MPVDVGQERTAWVDEARVPLAAIRVFEEDLARRTGQMDRRRL
jgi:hypothetical protein